MPRALTTTFATLVIGASLATPRFAHAAEDLDHTYLDSVARADVVARSRSSGLSFISSSGTSSNANGWSANPTCAIVKSPAWLRRFSTMPLVDPEPAAGFRVVHVQHDVSDLYGDRHFGVLFTTLARLPSSTFAITDPHFALGGIGNASGGCSMINLHPDLVHEHAQCVRQPITLLPCADGLPPANITPCRS